MPPTMVIFRTDQNSKCELVVKSEDEVVCSWKLLLVLPLDKVLSSLWTKIITICLNFKRNSKLYLYCDCCRWLLDQLQSISNFEVHFRGPVTSLLVLGHFLTVLSRWSHLLNSCKHPYYFLRVFSNWYHPSKFLQSSLQISLPWRILWGAWNDSKKVHSTPRKLFTKPCRPPWMWRKCSSWNLKLEFFEVKQGLVCSFDSLPYLEKFFS